MTTWCSRETDSKFISSIFQTLNINKMYDMFFPWSSLRMTDEFQFCCLAPPGISTCLPEPDEFSSCEDLMSNYVLRVSIWVLGMVSLVGNTLVIYWRIRDARDSKVSCIVSVELHLHITEQKVSSS